MDNEFDTNTATVTDDSVDNGLPIEGQQPIDGETQQTGQEPVSQEQQPQQQALAQPQQPGNPNWWKPDLFSLKYRGSQVSPRDYNHAVQLMQKGWSYEQAMSEVKQQKQEMDANRQRYEQYDRLDQAFRDNPTFAQRFKQWYEQTQRELQQGGQQQAQQYHQQPTGQLPPEFAQIQQQLREMQQWKQQAEIAKADGEVENEINALKMKFPDTQWEQLTETGHSLLFDILDHAHRNRFPSLAAAYRDYMFDNVANNAKMQGAQQVAQQRQARARQGVVSTGTPRPAAPASAPDIRNASYDDLAAMAKKDLGLG